MNEISLAPEPDKSQNERNQLRAFVSDDSTKQIVDQVVRDLMIPHASVQRGGIRSAIDHLSRERSPRILVVDISESELPLSDINELAEVCEPGVTVITLGDRNDVGLFRDLINNGISDYLVKPINAALLQKSLLTTVDTESRQRQTNRLGRLVGVLGTRGGVGSTMLATNLAWYIANRRHRRVALLDLDLQFGSVALSLDLEPTHGLREALENAGRIDSLYVDRTMAQHSETLYVLSAEENLDEMVLVDPGAVQGLLTELRNKFHYVIVDMHRGMADSTTKILEEATNLVLVTDLSLAGMRDTLRVSQMLPSTNASCQIYVAANRVGEHKNGEISRAEFEKGIGRRIDVTIPFDGKAVAASMNVGQPVVARKSAASAAIERLADLAFGAPQRKQGGLFRRLLSRRS